MQYDFYKYHGAGNDFIIIDNRKFFFDKKNKSYIENICNRRTGVGADGLILLENDSNGDFKMVYFNADGNESTMCGNGGRCIVAFAKKMNIINKETSFEAIDGLHYATIDDKNNVNLQMKDIDIIENTYTDFVLDTGSPHYVKVVDEFTKDFVELARNIRNSKRFKKEGINVNFIKVNENKVTIRTFERGVEDETLACGTGCVAAAISVMEINKTTKDIHLNAKGGELKVSATKDKKGYKNIWLYGPTAFVFKGTL